MCVLTYVPRVKGFIFTNNRDEDPNRPACIPPKEYTLSGSSLIYPKDPLGGGTWIASGPKAHLCLLNGGTVNHVKKGNYRQSRGMVILDFQGFEDVHDFYSNYAFDEMEPFTLVVKEKELFEIRWDHGSKTFKVLDETKPQIWSSVTLYSSEVIRKRESWFADFISKNPDPLPADILQFHLHGGEGDQQNDLTMNRDEKVKTLGISQIISSQQETKLHYWSLQ